MNENQCNVVRDLMPLCIDGVASMESQRVVDEHTGHCRDCALIYGEMRSALPQMAAEKEIIALERAARAMRTRRTIRTLWAVILGLTALMIALLANAGAVHEFLDSSWYRLRYLGHENEMRFHAYNVTLEWREWGMVDCTIDSSPSGNRAFYPDFQLRYDEMTGDAYLQMRAVSCLEGQEPWAGEEELPYDSLWDEGVFGFTAYDLDYDEDGMSYRYKELTEAGYTNWRTVDINRIELVCGEESLLLWQEGDGLPAYSRAGRVQRGTEDIPTATPYPTMQRYSVIVTPPPGTSYHVQTQTSVPKETPVPTRTALPRLPPGKR